MASSDAARVDVGDDSYRVTWSAEDEEYVATCLEFPSLSWLAGARNEAVDGLEKLLVDTVAEMAESGESVPQPWPRRRTRARSTCGSARTSTVTSSCKPQKNAGCG